MAWSGWKQDERDGLRRTFNSLPIYQAVILLFACLLFGIAIGSGGNGFASAQANAIVLLLVGWSVLVAIGLLDRGERRLGWRWSADFGCGLALVCMSGGVESLFLPVLCAQVLAASTIFGLRPSFLLASFATAVLATHSVFVLAEHAGDGITRAAQDSAGARVSYVVCWLIAQAIALHLMAFLGVGFMRRMRSVIKINDLVVKNIREGLVAMDHRGRILLMNDEALRILNYPPESPWQGRTPEEVFRRREDEPILAAFRRRSRDMLLEWKGARERSFPLSIRIHELSGEGKRKDSVWVALLRDETLEQRAAKAEARVRVLEELEDMARGLAHEIRNPLASIRGCVEELGRGRSSAAQEERLHAIVLKESSRLDRIVSEFMEYCRSTPTRRERFELVPLLREVIDSLELRPDARDILFELIVDDEATPSMVGERELIYRVFLNLGVNAVEASAGQGVVRFQIAPGTPNGWDVAVIDHGCGMDPDVMKRAFNPFFTTKTREGGLGLSIVDKIVNSHGGNIEVKSKVGEGSCFRVWFPAALAPTQAERLEMATAGAAP